MKTEIRTGTLRDVCFVAANLRPEDRREVFAQADLPDTRTLAVLSYECSAWCWTAWLDGQPVAAFGLAPTSPLAPHLWSAWAWGTRRMQRAVPEITRFCRDDWPPRLLALGVRRVEVRSIESHHKAHRWLKAMGMRDEGPIAECGLGGETFRQFAAVRGDFDHVHIAFRPAQGADPAAGADSSRSDAHQ